MWRQVAFVLHLNSEVEQVNSIGVTWLCEEALHLCWEWRQTLEEQPCSPRKFLTFFDAVLVTRNPWHASFTCKSAIGKMFFSRHTQRAWLPLNHRFDPPGCHYLELDKCTLYTDANQAFYFVGQQKCRIWKSGKGLLLWFFLLTL